MTKHIAGKQYRKEGKQRERLYTVIECDHCGHKTYARRSGRIQKALESRCKACNDGKPTYEELKSLQASVQLDGRTFHPLYATYQSMMDRCFNEKCKHYPNYGGAGISVCVRWIVDFWAFVDDVGEKPSPEHTMDRVNPFEDYHPNNIRWATREEQMLNRRSSFVLLTEEERVLQDKAIQAIYHKRGYKVRPKGWWRENFGLYENPYIYGPMPWKRTGVLFRKQEAIERGWHVPLKLRKK